MKQSTLLIEKNSNLLAALKQMDSIGRKLLIVVDDSKYYGLISIGDIQRAIIKNVNLDSELFNILRDDYIVANPLSSFNQIKQMMIKMRCEFMPVINDEKEIIQIYFWEDIFETNKNAPKRNFNVPVVIMAGGKGTRLKPLTNVIPKPLIPVGERTILEEIIQHFTLYGVNEFYLTVNYKAELIEYYLNQLQLPLKIHFVYEEKPLGTGGSLSMLKGKVNKSFFVTNCDIIIDNDYSEILDYHEQNDNLITVVASLKHYPISYGTIETGDSGELVKLVEKPEITFKINSGMYILNSSVLEYIPESRFYNITDLIEDVKKRNGKVGVYPVSENSWKDIGEWSKYNEILKAYQ